MAARKAKRGVTVDEAGKIACALPGVTEGVSYGTRGWRVGKKFMMRQKEKVDGVLVMLTDSVDEQEFLIERDPEVFFITDHYRGYAAVLVRLAKVERADLAALIARAWRSGATKKLLAERDTQGK
jgi:hypothetical protein